MSHTAGSNDKVYVIFNANLVQSKTIKENDKVG